jgi:hypothetical protein
MERADLPSMAAPDGPPEAGSEDLRVNPRNPFGFLAVVNPEANRAAANFPLL